MNQNQNSIKKQDYFFKLSKHSTISAIQNKSLKQFNQTSIGFRSFMQNDISSAIKKNIINKEYSNKQELPDQTKPAKNYARFQSVKKTNQFIQNQIFHNNISNNIYNIINEQKKEKIQKKLLDDYYIKGFKPQQKKQQIHHEINVDNYFEKKSKHKQTQIFQNNSTQIARSSKNIKQRELLDPNELLDKQRSNSIKNDNLSKFRIKIERNAINEITQNNNCLEIKQEVKQQVQIDEQSFKLIEIIGKGGYAYVWKSASKFNHKLFAVKIIDKKKIIEKNCLKSILNERQILIQINSKFIVNMICCFQNEQNLYIIMKYMSGGDLRFQIYLQKKFSERTTKFIICCLILAFEQIHQNNILHRDLKPENIVIDHKGYIKLTDFGIARFKKPDNHLETSGTLGYMSPEVLLQQNHSFTTDYFALGVLTYELMTGKRPFLGKDKEEILDAMIKNRVEINEQVLPLSWKPQAIDFINQLLLNDPTKRLGHQGIQQLKQHPWIKDMDWIGIQEKRIKSSLIIDPNKSYFKKIQMVQEENQQYSDKFKRNLSQLQNYLKYYNFLQKQRCKKLFNK